MSEIEQGKVTIKEAFDWWFRVPEYQRPYVWETDQVNNLLDDVSQALETKPESEYFLGSIVLQRRTVKDELTGDYAEYDLLDGQQRLVTCLIIHAVGRDLADDERLRRNCSEAVSKEADNLDNIPERLRIVFDTRDDLKEFVAKFLKSGGGTSDESALRSASGSKNLSVRNMANAVLEVRRYFSQLGASDLFKFFRFLRNKVLLIYVTSDQLDDAIRLFTVLNARGVRLRSSDILKAKNLGELRDTGASADEQKLAAKMWEDMDSDLGDDLDVFLSHVRSILVKEKARLGLVDEFEQNIYRPRAFDRETKEYTKLEPLVKPGAETFAFLKRYWQHHKDILGGEHHALTSSYEFDNLISLLTDAGTADFWMPPLLRYRDAFGDERITDFLRRLENKFSADWIARETPTNRVEAMNAVTKKIDELKKQSGLQPGARIEALLSSDVFGFNRDELLRQLDTGAIYGRHFTRYVLYKLDMIYGGTSNRLQPPKEMTIEHILPQDPAEDSLWCRDFSPQQREEWTDRLGNLVLISGRKNTAQGRLDYREKKRRFYEKRIESFPNAQRVINQNDDWTPIQLTTNHTSVLKVLSDYCTQP